MALISFPIQAIILTLPSLIASWTYPAYINLAWPSIGNKEYVTLNGTWTSGHGQGDPVFPCGMIPVNPHQQRVPFPTTGGRMEFGLVNSTGTLQEYSYVVDPYFGQISADHSSGQTKWKYITTYSYSDFSTGLDCSDGVNATKFISAALADALDSHGDGPPLDIIGMNATIGIRMVLFSGDNNVEEMDQCAYVTFVSPETFVASREGGFCNNAKAPSIVTMSGGLVATLAPTATASAFTTATRTDGADPTVVTVDTTAAPTGLGGVALNGSLSSHTARTLAIGVGVGVSMGAALMFLLIGTILLRRRRRVGPTMSLDFFHGFGWAQSQDGNEEREDKQIGKFQKGKAVDTGGESDSARSVRLPTYAEATEGKEKTVIQV